MSDNMSIRTFLAKYDNDDFNGREQFDQYGDHKFLNPTAVTDNRQAPIAAGWYHWFCNLLRVQILHLGTSLQLQALNPYIQMMFQK